MIGEKTLKRRKKIIASAVSLAVILAVSVAFLISYLNRFGSDTSNNEIDLKKSKPLNVLLVGGDVASKNTDTIMIVNYDPSTSGINLLSVPRDTRVNIDGRDRKINFAYPSGGSERIVGTLKELLDISIDRYAYLDVSAFRDIIDVLGGVEYTVPVDMKYDDTAQNLHIDLKAGSQILDGIKAEQFIRFRKPNTFNDLPAGFTDYYNGSDINRIKAQQDFFRELIKQKATVGNLPKLIKAFDIIIEKLKTDFTLGEILAFANDIRKIDLEDVKTFVLSGNEKTINGVWYYDFNDKILHDGKSHDASVIIKEYFASNQE